MDTSDRGLSLHLKGPGAVANGLTDIKNVLVMYLTLLTVATYARVFQCPHTQKSMGMRSGERGGCTSKTKYGNILIWNFFPRVGVENSLMKFVQVVYIHPTCLIYCLFLSSCKEIAEITFICI